MMTVQAMFRHWPAEVRLRDMSSRPT